jgi:hypothetical protein
MTGYLEVSFPIADNAGVDGDKRVYQELAAHG